MITHLKGLDLSERARLDIEICRGDTNIWDTIIPRETGKTGGSHVGKLIVTHLDHGTIRCLLFVHDIIVGPHFKVLDVHVGIKGHG
jgi:hypothetical protein